MVSFAAMKQLLHVVTRNYINRYDPTLAQLQLAVRTTIASFSAYLLILWFHRPEALWLGMPTLLFCFCFTGPSLLYRYSLLTGTILATGLGILTATVAGQHIAYYLPLSFVLACIAFYITQYGLSITLAAIMSFTMIAIAGSRSAPFHEAVLRMENIGLAGLLVLFLSSVVYPYRIHHFIEKCLKLTSAQLQRYCNSLFTGAVCGFQSSPEIASHQDRCFSNLKTTRTLITIEEDSQQLKRWRLFYRMFNCLRSIQNLLNEAGNTQTFNTLSRYLTHIDHVVSNCLTHLDTTQGLLGDAENRPHIPGLTRLEKIVKELAEEASCGNEDIASMAFLVGHLHLLIQEYHEIALTA